MLAPRDLPLLPIFVAVAEAGSFTTAARKLGLAKSVVSLHVRTLEDRCGVRLMERSTRRLRLTQVGEHVLEAARAALGSVRALEQIVQGHRDAPTGVLRVTVPLDSSLSAMLAPIAASLIHQHPDLRVDLSFDDRVADLIKDRFDVAVRLGAMPSSSYVVRRLGSEPEIIVASPQTIERWIEVQTPDRLSGAPWVVHSGLPVRSAWTFRSSRSAKQVQATVKVAAGANTVFALRDLLVASAGFGLLPFHVVRGDIEEGRLLHVCPDWSSRKLILHALLPTRKPPPRVSVFLARLSEAAPHLGFDAV